ncbi:hypothetical protein [Azospirillum canadense]|uniref:hypothetical protein n=1 Tax=Azospirillum canadense TaxID=403962 RepID=UPI002227A279|nr:hypothetical protein [Azospirillum canadense]MCW2236829.1 hypothetical protein [Azospirillum canadense]
MCAARETLRRIAHCRIEDAIEALSTLMAEQQSMEFRQPNTISQALRHRRALADQEDNARRRRYGVVIRVVEFEPAFVGSILDGLR